MPYSGPLEKDLFLEFCLDLDLDSFPPLLSSFSLSLELGLGLYPGLDLGPDLVSLFLDLSNRSISSCFFRSTVP